MTSFSASEARRTFVLVRKHFIDATREGLARQWKTSVETPWASSSSSTHPTSQRCSRSCGDFR